MYSDEDQYAEDRMSPLNSIMRLGLSLFLLEFFIMLIMAYLQVPEELVWQRTLWDATSVALIAVSILCYWLRKKKNISRSQLGIAAAKSATIVFSTEAALMLLLGMLPVGMMADWLTTLFDGLAFATIVSPAIYYWILKPLMDKGYTSAAAISIRSSIALTVLISFSVLLFDISLPLGVAGGVPYIALVLIGLWFPQRNAAIGLAVIGTILTIVGYYVSEPMGLPWMVMINRGVALFAIWITAILVTSQKLDTAELKLLYAIAEDANKNMDPGDVLRSGLADVCRYAEWPLGHVYLPADNMQARFLSSDIWYVKDDKTFAPFVRATIDIGLERGRGFPRQVLDSSESIWINDLAGGLSLPRSQAAAIVGLKGGCAVPIMAGGEVVSVMEFFSDRTEHPDANMMKLLNNIGGQLGRVFERALAEQKLSHMASHDSLTGLPNLRLAKDRLSGSISMARRNSAKAALMFVDLDGFKLINDTMGHDAGDQLLKEVSTRFASCIREVDTVARIGGDEFIIILTNINSKDGAGKVAKKVIDAVNEPFELQEHHASVGVSIGIAIYPDHGGETEVLLNKADEAMYRVKAKGKNNYTFASG